MTENATQSRLIRKLQPGKKGYNAVAWSPDGTRLAMGGDDRYMYIFTVDGQLLARCAGHENLVWSVAWSPDGRWLASGSRDRSVRVWEVASGTEHWRCTGHAAGVRSVAWSPDGCWLASGSDDGSVRVWEAASGRECKRFDFPEDEAYAWRLCWASSGAFLVSTHRRDTVRFWSTCDLAILTAPLSPPSTVPHPVPTDLAPLPATLAVLHRLQLFPPLALVRDLLAILAGDAVPDALHTLASHPGLGQPVWACSPCCCVSTVARTGVPHPNSVPVRRAASSPPPSPASPSPRRPRLHQWRCSRRPLRPSTSAC